MTMIIIWYRFIPSNYATVIRPKWWSLHNFHQQRHQQEMGFSDWSLSEAQAECTMVVSRTWPTCRLEFSLNATGIHWIQGIQGKLINHWSINWAQFKDTVSYMYLTGAMVISWSLKQEVAGSNHFTVMTNIFVTEFAEFGENIWGKLNWFDGNPKRFPYSLNEMLILY